jgi:ABC-type Fe3+-siderophore transport system permease subunit
MKKLATLFAIFTLALALASPALAQSPTQDAYGGTLGEQVGGGGNGAPAPEQAPAETAPAAKETGSLPFTGFEVGIIVLAGIALAGAGYTLRRTTRKPTA